MMRIYPTRRLIRVLAIGAPLWLAALWIPLGWLAGAVFLVAVGVRCRGDWARIPPSSLIEVERTVPSRVSQGESVTVGVEVQNRSGQGLHLELRDEWPVTLVGQELRGRTAIPDGGEGHLRSSARAMQRGEFVFGRVVLRVSPAGGLVARELAFPIPTRLKVYPAFRSTSDYELLARLDERNDQARRPRVHPSQGTDFESLRFYIPGEDLRHVDWKATARRGTLVSRNRQVERGQQVAVLLDTGRLMGETIGELTRLDHMVSAAVMLSYVVQKRGDTFLAVSFSNRLEASLPPIRGSRIMSRTLETFSKIQPKPVESDYWQGTAEAMGMLRRRSLVVVLSDMMDPVGARGLLSNLRRASRKHVVLCVLLAEPRLQTTAKMFPETFTDAYEKAAACELLRRRRIALDQMRAHGLGVLESTPEQLSVRLIRRYLEIRQANLQ